MGPSLPTAARPRLLAAVAPLAALLLGCAGARPLRGTDPVGAAADAATAGSEDDGEMHYGKTRWGMSQSSFQQVYPAAVRTAPGRWALGTGVGRHDAVRTFHFVDDQLVDIDLVFADTHRDPVGFVDDYREIQARLVARYGEPAVDQQRWSDETFRDTPEQWGMALVNDHVRFAAQWSVPGMNVRHFLQAEGIDIVHGVIYVSARLWDLVEDARGGAAPRETR